MIKLNLIYVNFVKNIVLTLYKIRQIKSFGLKEKIIFYRSLSYMLDGGISLIESLNNIKNTTKNSGIYEICEKISVMLLKGDSFYRAMYKLNGYFEIGDVTIVKSGENSGKLIDVLKYLSEEYEFLINLKNKYISALIYPIFIFLVSIGSVYIIMVYVFPSIIQMISQFDGIKIPFAIQIMSDLFDFFKNNLFYLIYIFFLFTFGFTIYFSTEDGKIIFEKMLFRSGIIGNVIKYYNLIKFLRFLKLLISSGVNYVEVFYLLKELMGSLLYKKMCDDIIENLRKGESFINVFYKYEIILPIDVISFLKVGEQSASIEKSLSKIIWFYDQEFNKIIDGLSKIIEPFLIVFVGGIIGIIAFSMFGLIGNVLDSVDI